MQDGVLDAAAVEVDRRPVSDLGGIERQFVVVGVGKAVEIPRRIDERVHRVGFPTCRLAANRAGGVDELRHLRERRIAAAGELRDPRQHHGQLVVGDGDRAVLGTMNDRDRRAPVTLA